jgi:glutaredoxin 3
MSTQTAKVVMYATDWCSYCARARALFERERVVFEQIDIDRDPSRREEMIARSGRRTVPQIFVGDVHIGGYDDLHALYARGGIDPLFVSQEAQNHG